MTANGPAAHDFLLSYEPLQQHGACWHYVWEAYAQAGASTSHGALPTAYDAWNASYGKHYDMNPPQGAAIWLGRRYDGNMWGDVFIAGAYDGDHAATDQPTYGYTATTTIHDRMNLCGREYLGWTDHVLDVPIALGGTPQPEPPPIPIARKDQEMIVITNADTGDVYTIGAGFLHHVDDGTERDIAVNLYNWGNDWRKDEFGTYSLPGGWFSACLSANGVPPSEAQKVLRGKTYIAARDS